MQDFLTNLSSHSYPESSSVHPASPAALLKLYPLQFGFLAPTILELDVWLGLLPSFVISPALPIPRAIHSWLNHENVTGYHPFVGVIQSSSSLWTKVCTRASLCGFERDEDGKRICQLRNRVIFHGTCPFIIKDAGDYPGHPSSCDIPSVHIHNTIPRQNYANRKVCLG